MKRYLLFALLFLLPILAPAVAVAVPEDIAGDSAGDSGPVARTILAFSDSHNEVELAWTKVHQLAEMPLNHLGLKVRFHDMRDPLPDLQQMDDVRGILIWLEQDTIPRAEEFLRWNIKAAKAGKRIVVMGPPGFLYDEKHRPLGETTVEDFWRQLGLKPTNRWTRDTFDTRFEYQPYGVVGFELPIAGVMPGYEGMEAVDERVTSHLRAVLKGNRDVASTLVSTGPGGGYAGQGYAARVDYDTELRKWYLDPFKFFRLAFATDDLPKPDTTTLSGRRIYYSHIDGDGWRNYVLIPRYKKRRTYAAEVILEEVFKKYPDLPTSVGPIAADLAEEWLGDEDTRRIARAIFRLPNIEAASHTYSHPLDWGFFRTIHPGMEDKYRYLFPKRVKRRSQNLLDLFVRDQKSPPPPPDSAAYMRSMEGKGDKERSLNTNYKIPRAYFTGEYSMEKEVLGSFAEISRYLLPGKKVEVLFWSGNTQPYPEVIRLSREAGARNLNGGDTRFDRKFNSYAWVAPIGRQVGDQQQIYSSNSNENTYTNLWTGPFFGFHNLVQTLDNTDTPIRVKPINVYYHMYSGERLASLKALHEIFDHAESQPIVPITASHFAGIGDGFYSTRLEKLGEQQWRVSERDRLQTLRFDHAAYKAVDFSRSRGVVGQNHLNGSLYVQLDPAVDLPVVALRQRDRADTEPEAVQPYLIDGRWPLRQLEHEGDEIRFTIQGFGKGEMNWWMPQPGRYEILRRQFNGEENRWQVDVGADHKLRIALDRPPHRPQHYTVRGLDGSR